MGRGNILSQRMIVATWAVFFADLARWNSIWDATWSVLGFLAVVLTVEALRTEELSCESLSRTPNIVVWVGLLPLWVVTGFLAYIIRTCFPAHHGQVFPFVVILCLCVISGMWAELSAQT